jgi:hypothetical protein
LGVLGNAGFRNDLKARSQHLQHADGVECKFEVPPILWRHDGFGFAVSRKPGGFVNEIAAVVAMAAERAASPSSHETAITSWNSRTTGFACQFRYATRTRPSSKWIRGFSASAVENGISRGSYRILAIPSSGLSVIGSPLDKWALGSGAFWNVGARPQVAQPKMLRRKIDQNVPYQKKKLIKPGQYASGR